MDSGRKLDVLFEDVFYTDMRTGIEVKSDSFLVWADKGLKDIILNVDGVIAVHNTLFPTRYEVSIDHRYDAEYIKREIEAEIRCKDA